MYMYTSDEYVCVKFGWRSTGRYRKFGKTAQGGQFLCDTLYAHWNLPVDFWSTLVSSWRLKPGACFGICWSFILNK